MNIKDFLANREKPPELFWSLVIEKGWVQAGIWYIGTEAAEILNISPAAAWSADSELVDACDAALSSAVAKLPENYTEPNKTVFGVASNWVKGGEIQDEYLAKIKDVCADLSLTPVGFVVLPEAVAHLYKSEEGTPLSAVIVGLGEDTLEVSVFKLGNLAGTTAVARSVSLTEDVTEGLSRFEGATPLPSRIIVYDGKGGELEDAKEELTKASWDTVTKVKFLHTPKVEVLVSDRKVLATSLAGAAEIGDVSHVNSISEDQEETPSLPPKEEIENIEEPLEPIAAEEMGFVVGQDITENSEPPKMQNISLPEPPIIIKEPVTPKVLQKTRNLFHGFSSKLKIKTPSTFNHKIKLPILTGLIVLVVLILGVISYAWFIPKATVTVFVSPKTYQEQLSLYFNTEGQFDEVNSVIPGTLISAEATGDKTKSTTGTKLIGDKASGSVQIVNGNGNPIRLSPGTILTSSGGLKFLTNSEASVSGQLIPGSPGTATLSVTAGDIGAQYNLAKGEVFKVGAFDKSQVAATSQADFSGGSSQQIAAISTDDQKKLEADLKTELSGQVIQDLANKVTKDQVFVNDLSDLKVTSEKFDHNVGDVAETLKLSLTVKGTGIAADKVKLLQYTTDLLKSKIPTGYAVRSNQIGFKFTFAGKKDENIGYDVDINADFLPMVSKKDLSQQIAGKSAAVVEDYLTSVPGYVRAEIKLDSLLPPPFRTLPHIPKNINIDIVSEE